jgi:hypothetical protein
MFLRKKIGNWVCRGKNNLRGFPMMDPGEKRTPSALYSKNNCDDPLKILIE